MGFEALIIDSDKGHHKRATGNTALSATTAAFRKIMEHHLDATVSKEQQKKALDSIDQEATMRTFLVTSPEDECCENTKTLKEDIHDLKLLVRVDKTKETYFTPCGCIREVF